MYALFKRLSPELQQDITRVFAPEMEQLGLTSMETFVEQTDTSLYSLFRLALVLRSGRLVVFVTGAGLSYASGITPYRYSNKAIWSNFVMASGERRSFKEDPDHYWNSFWLRTHEIPSFINAVPNQGHISISKLMRRAAVLIITQNIDTLHTKAGALEERLIEIHGRLGLYKCVNQPSAGQKVTGRQRDCPYSRSISIKIKNLSDYAVNGTSIHNNNLRIRIPRCPGCLAPVMPHALMFDEQYVSHDFYRYYEAEQWLRAASAIVFVGTSFSVNITQDGINIALESTREIELYNCNVNKDERIEEASYQTAYQRLLSQGSKPHVPFLKLRWIIGPSEDTLPLLERVLAEFMSNAFAGCFTPGSTAPPSFSDVSPPQGEVACQPKVMYCYYKEEGEQLGSPVLMM